ncbi:MAG: ketopantoate reductase family protein [Candidatus Heimdallarchaeota archaeon]
MGLNYGVIGVGPSGGILAAYLARSGERVVGVDVFEEHVESIKNDGLHISGFAELTANLADCFCSISELAGREFDVIFVSTKASVLEPVIGDLEKIYSEIGTPAVISHQNGIDTEKRLALTFGKENSLRTVINYAGNFVEKGHLRMNFFSPPNYIGGPQEDLARKVSEDLTKAGLETEFTDDIQHYVWEKSILNASMSALCAVTRQTMREALDFAPTEHLTRDLLTEAIAVAKAAGQDYGANFVEWCMNYLNKAGDHKTSMLVDVLNQNKTEIDYINGKIVEYGKEHGVPAPVNETIVALIKATENQYQRSN